MVLVSCAIIVAMFISSLAETLIAQINPLSYANSLRPSSVCSGSSYSPDRSCSNSMSHLLPHSTIGMGVSTPAIISSTYAFHSASISMVAVSVKSPTKMAPELLRQNDLLMPAKLVSIPTKSQIWSLTSLPLIFIILV